MGDSQALQEWKTARAARLDELAAVRERIDGARQYLVDQLDRGYLLALAAQFQGFCRDLHSEGVASIVAVLPVDAQPVVSLNLLHGRFLDRGNPRAGALGSDFGRLGVSLWPELKELVVDGSVRHDELEQLMIWRNAVAHESQLSDGEQATVGSTQPDLGHVNRWRENLDVLADKFDHITRERLARITGSDPW